jgi:hypothetical protein
MKTPEDAGIIADYNAEVRMSNNVNHPSHYHAKSGIEVIDAIEAWDLGFSLGNAVKYIARAGHKNDRLEDLRKAAWYIQREIGRLEIKLNNSTGTGERR